MLGLKLIAPDGEFITLFTNQTDAAGNNVQTRGITGANVGVNNGFLVGTTFTDSAARSIVDINPTGGRGASAPYVGDFRVENDGFVVDPDGRTLTAFLNKVLSNGAINGTWKLETIDTTTSAPTTPASVDFWTINLSTGMKPDLDVAVPGTNGLIIRRFVNDAVPNSIGCFAGWYQSWRGPGLRQYSGVFQPIPGSNLRRICRLREHHGCRRQKSHRQHRYLLDVFR